MAGCARPPNPKISFSAARHRLLVVIYKFRLVSVQEPAAAAVAHFAFMIRDKHVQHLSRADPIEHVNPKSLLPSFAKLRRQCLSRGYAQTETTRVQRTNRVRTASGSDRIRAGVSVFNLS